MPELTDDTQDIEVNRCSKSQEIVPDVPWHGITISNSNLMKKSSPAEVNNNITCSENSHTTSMASDVGPPDTSALGSSTPPAYIKTIICKSPLVKSPARQKRLGAVSDDFFPSDEDRLVVVELGGKASVTQVLKSPGPSIDLAGVDLSTMKQTVLDDSKAPSTESGQVRSNSSASNTAESQETEQAAATQKESREVPDSLDDITATSLFPSLLRNEISAQELEKHSDVSVSKTNKEIPSLHRMSSVELSQYGAVGGARSGTTENSTDNRLAHEVLAEQQKAESLPDIRESVTENDKRDAGDVLADFTSSKNAVTDVNEVVGYPYIC